MARGKALDEEILTDSTYYILIALVKPIHGYKIMQEVKRISNDEVIIGPASLYTILRKLQEANLIELINDNEERRKTYSLTSKGANILKNDIKRRINMVKQGQNALKEIAIRYAEEE